MRSWLYRIASNVCFDMLKGRQRRALPMDLMEAIGQRRRSGCAADRREQRGSDRSPIGACCRPTADPAEEAEVRESVRLAFVAALQHLPPRQRAVLILREVLKWKANEVAELLDTTVVSVNSALQRARATLGGTQRRERRRRAQSTTISEELLARYVDAFERFDIESLVALLHEDATMSMPPYPLWMQGAGEYCGRGCSGPGVSAAGRGTSAINANGTPGFAQWRAEPGGGYEAWAIHVLHVSDGRIASLDFFVDTNLFPLFGLPIRIES